MAAETYSASDVTVLVAAGTYVEHDTISVPGTDTLTVQGAGAGSTTINADSGGSVILINGGHVTVAGLTITGGSAPSGGGIHSDGTTTIARDTISNNTATDAGAGEGGGVYIAAGTTATIQDDTLSGNVSAFNGGAAYIAAGASATLENDTIAANLADSFVNGVYNSGSTTVIDDTFANNVATFHAGPGLATSGGEITISNSILLNSYCSDSAGALVDGGYNVESDNTCGFGSFDTINSATINLSPMLSANGSSGPQTFAIGTDSSAYKEVPPANCTIGTDERDRARPGVPGQYCDAGAFEYQLPLTPSAPTISNLPTSGTYGARFSPAISTTGDGTTSTTSATTAICTVTGGVVSYVGVGTCGLVAHVAAGTNYAGADGVAQTFPIMRAAPSAPRISNLPSRGSEGGRFKAAISSNGDGAPSVTSSTTTICIASGTTVSYVGVGRCTLVAHIAQGADYAAADGAAQSLSIIAVPQPIVSVAAERYVIIKQVLPLRLSCAGARCAGVAELIQKVRIKHLGRASHGPVVSYESIVLAKRSFDIAMGKRATVHLRLTAAGKAALKGARHSPVRASLRITVARGTTQSKLITVR